MQVGRNSNLWFVSFNSDWVARQKINLQKQSKWAFSQYKEGMQDIDISIIHIRASCRQQTGRYQSVIFERSAQHGAFLQIVRQINRLTGNSLRVSLHSLFLVVNNHGKLDDYIKQWIIRTKNTTPLIRLEGVETSNKRIDKVTWEAAASRVDHLKLQPKQDQVKTIQPKLWPIHLRTRITTPRLYYKHPTKFHVKAQTKIYCLRERKLLTNTKNKYPVNVHSIIDDQKAECLQWSCEKHSKLITILPSRISTESYNGRSGAWRK